MNTKTEIEQLKKHISELEARADRNRHAQRNLQQIEWMLAGRKPEHADYVPDYGDLSLLNQGGLILTTVGRKLLGNIASEYLDLLETSAAIYERDGSYALGLFSSGWCQMMDAASRRLCSTDDNREALQSGKWLCHESCWKNASLQSMETGQAVDIACSGGIRLYAVPVWAGGDIVGSINFGYGDPPTDENTLGVLSRQFKVPLADLRRQARAYASRPPFVIDYAKTRLEKAAAYLGAIIEREQSIQALRAGEQQLLAANQQLTATEEQQRESESRYRALFENMAAASCMDEIVYENGRAVDYRIIDVNPAYERITGIRRQDAVGSLASVLYGLGQAPFLDVHSRVAETGEPAEFETWFEPIQKHLHITVGRPKPGFFSTVFTDITERKKAEEQIRDNETRLQSLIRILQHQSSSVQGFLDYALDEAIQLTESRLGYIYFYNEKNREFTLNTWSKGVMNVCAVTEPQIVYQLENTGIWGEAVRQRKAILINDFQAPHPLKKGFPDGHAPLNKFLTVPVFSGEKIVAVVGVANKETDYDPSDVLQLRLLMDGVWKETDRILRETALRQEKEWSRKIIDNAPNIILGLQENAKIAVFNKFAERLTGYTAQEVIGKEWISLFIPQENQEILYQTWNEIVDNQLMDHQFENEIVTKSGELRLIKWHNAVLTENNAFWMILSVGEDITAQKALAAQFQQAQKMESVGRLAGGVAHDYNNMLSIIIGYTQLAMGKVGAADRLHADLKEIDKAAQRSVDITRKLLGFARKQTVSPKVLDLNSAVEGMLKMLRRLLREDLTLSWQPGTGVWQVKIDPSQVDQVLMNLCVNARDAIDGTGEITIETGNRVFDQDYCADHNGFVPGEFVMLAVSDNGCGMDKNTLDQMFEPFFTTKQVGQGSGLGLAMVYGIVKHNKGFVNVYSEPGRGTTLKLYFARDRTGIVEKTVADIPHPDAGRGETILVVEDESALLKLATRLLETLGYTVLSASHPDDALRLAKTHPGKIHLLLTDVVMPDMNGRELADRLLALYPDLKRVFMSGYTANVIAHQGVLDKGMHFIQKPLSIHALAATVRQVLDNP